LCASPGSFAVTAVAADGALPPHEMDVERLDDERYEALEVPTCTSGLCRGHDQERAADGDWRGPLTAKTMEKVRHK